MPSVKKIAAALMILAVSFAPPHLMSSWDAIEAEASGVLQRYFDALSQGDTVTLRSLMGGRLLDSQQMLLGNPLWPGHLGRTFGDAEFSIEGIEAHGKDEVAIEASINFGVDDYVVRRFVLRRGGDDAHPHAPFRVVEERDPGIR